VNVTTETRLEEIDPTLLKAWMDKGEAVLVDVREPGARRILEARLVPLSSFNPAQVPQEPDKKVVFHCLTGTGSAQAGRKLLASGFAQVYNLKANKPDEGLTKAFSSSRGTPPSISSPHGTGARRSTLQPTSGSPTCHD
jgi:rhodanese-related sulfurtransferase